jgi:nucleotide-binding universal stress UspA family protein
MLKKILFADSGIGTSEDMLKVLLDLPAVQGAHIDILHVVPPQLTTEATTEKWEEGNALVANTMKTLHLDPSKVTTIVRQGEPKDVVCQVADETKADLIIMGSRGLKRLEAILGNSVSQYVFQLTNHPMLLVRDDIFVRKIKRIMVALDKSEASQYALNLAIHLLRGYSAAELFLARVNPDLNPELLPLSKTETENNPIIAAAISKVKTQGINYRCVVTAGKPAEQICNLAEENNIDLLLLGSPDRRPSVAKSLPDLDRLLGTSLSDYVRVNANCPVLLARTNN